MFFFTLLFVSLFSSFVYGMDKVNVDQPKYTTISVYYDEQLNRSIEDQQFSKDLKKQWKAFYNGQTSKSWSSWTWETLQHPVVGAVASVIVTKGMQAVLDRVFVDQEEKQQQKEVQKQQLEMAKQQIIANEFIFRNAESEELERCKKCMLHGSSSEEKKACTQQYFILLELKKQRLEKQLEKPS